MPLDQLRAYLPEPTRAPDFDAYWQHTLDSSRQQPLNISLTPVEYPVDGVQVSEVRYDGWRGARTAGF
jgi:cephalosporin-C deacetylase